MNANTQLLPADNVNPALLLRALEIYNWGPFTGLHRAEIDPRGSAIIGPTGSGKTTLVDALMTLIAAQPKYNLASTGGHESDRDLVSYVRGVTGAGNASGDNLHIARSDKTVTGICARFANAAQSITIGALFWIDGTSSAPSDLKRLWLFSERSDQTLSDWLERHHEGGSRLLKQLGRETEKLQIHDSKRAYLAQLRRYFEVGENAFTLLNRAAGLKQLNSIDEIFRELVLDDHAAFDRATEVAAEFDDLAAIHQELETARRQQQSLLPIERLNRDHLQSRDQLSQQQLLLRLLPIHFAVIGQRLWGHQVERLLGEIDGLGQQLTQQEQQERELQGQADALKDIYLKAGGAGIEQLEEQIATQQSLTAERRRNADDYRKLARALSLDDSVSAAVLLSNQQRVAEQRSHLERRLADEDETRLQQAAELVNQQKLAATLREELQKIRARPGSNLPGNYQDFRAELATALSLDEAQLPFVAELIEVKAEESAWRGAIERAIGGHRLRILVPAATMQPALDWVNGRDNRLHVRLQEVALEQAPAPFMADGFTRKLNFKSHPHREALKALLATIDRHCVDSPTRLRQTPHGMTAQGLMSGKRGQFEKQDQKPLAQGWMTGFDNRDRLASLGRELQQAETERDHFQTGYDRAEQQANDTRSKLDLLHRLAELEYQTIDLPGAEATLTHLQERLSMLTDPDSDVARARRDFEQAGQQLAVLRKRIRELEGERSRLQERCDTAAGNRDSAGKRMGEGLNADQQRLVEKRLPSPGEAQIRQLDQLERAERQRIETEVSTLEGKRNRLQQQLVRQMEVAQKADTGALAEVGSELLDIPDYLERLRQLNEEALPEKQQRFLSYLNHSSDQGVTQLLAGIDNEVTIIEERIADLNQTLRRVDFQPGRYLQLQPRRVTHESLRTLQAAQRHLRAAALKDDEGESHYRALANMVTLLRDAADNKRTVGARALLDPRYRLQFAVALLDRESDRVIELRTGSQGGSGGEKEIIASYILTASLSYALCPEGSTQPLFGTIVLDEAFSKSSQAVAGRIISALREFGLHPLFVTPNKEMRLLRAHTRSAILVHRKGACATLTDLSWEELEAHAQQRLHG